MATWQPITNGFQGVVQERSDRWYIVWDGYIEGETITKRFRVTERTKERLIEGLENDNL